MRRMSRLPQEAGPGGDAEVAEASAMSMSRRKRAFTGRLGEVSERGQRGRIEAGSAHGGRREMEIAGSSDLLTLPTPTYYDLWFRVWDECFISVKNPVEHAFYSGFTGQRAGQTWTERMRTLDKLGFVRLAEGAVGPLSHVLIMNPHKVIDRLSKQKNNSIPQALFNAFRARASEIGAKI